MMKYPEGEEDPRGRVFWIELGLHTATSKAQLTAFEAKKAGTLAEQNMKQMGIAWVTFENRQMEYRPTEPGEHYQLIVAATWEKVRQNPEVKRPFLLSTGDLILKPDHHQEPNAPGAWHYYEILTEIRSQLRREN